MAENNNSQDRRKEFQKKFEHMCYSQGVDRREAWGLLMEMFACTLSNTHEVREHVKKKREARFEECKARLGYDAPVSMLYNLMASLVEDPAQDFLGEMYMSLSMGKKGWGQVFTPYHMCHMMSRMVMSDFDEAIAEKGYITVSDPSVGGGAMLIAYAQVLREEGLDPRTQMLAVGQDIDITAVCMAYVQLAIIGCPAVIVHGDSLAKPYAGNPLFLDMDENNWYTPALFSETWDKRRMDDIKKRQAELNAQRNANAKTA